MLTKTKNMLVLSLLSLLLFTNGCNGTRNEVSTITPINTPTVPTAETALETDVPAVLPSPNPVAVEAPGLGELAKISLENVTGIKPLAVIGEGNFYDEIAVSPDGRLLAAAAQGGVILLDAVSGERTAFLSTRNAIISMAFSPDGRFLAELHETPSGELYPETTFIAGLEMFVPVLVIWDVVTREPLLIQNLSGRGCGDYYAENLQFSPDGKSLTFHDFYSLLGHARTDNICVISASDGRLVKTIPISLPWETASAASTTPALFSADGQSILTAVYDTTSATPVTRVRRYDLSSGELIQEFDGQGWINDMALSPDPLLPG